MWHPARRGFSLFTLIVKFNIRNNAHSRSWNSSSDARIGWMTCCSYHSRKSVYRYISLFFVTMLLLARLSFVANSPLNAVFTFTLPYLSIASRTCSRTTLLASSKKLQLDVNRVYHRTCQYTILERGVDFSLDKRSFVATHVLATRVLATNVHETSLQLRLCTRESRDPRHRELSVSNGEVRTLGTTKFFELLDALVASL